MSRYTALADTEKKLDIIEHINNDHRQELLAIAQLYSNNKQLQKARLDDVFAEGCAITTDDSKQRQLFVKFAFKGDLEEQILYLAYLAMLKSGRQIGSRKLQYFSVVKTSRPTPNMLRLVLSSEQPINTSLPGFAYGFSLKKISKMRRQGTAKNSKLALVMQRAMLGLFRWMPTAGRQKMLQSFGKGIRYYTLRKVYKSDKKQQFANRAWVDIYQHGNSPGTLWSAALQKGDIIQSTVEYRPKYSYVNQGKALLLADETSMPALLSIFENWQNPQPPLVVLFSHHACEQEYISAEMLPANSSCWRFSGSQQQLWQQLEQLLPTLAPYDVCWAGLESEMAKKVRSYMRHQCQLPASSNRARAYWLLK